MILVGPGIAIHKCMMASSNHTMAHTSELESTTTHTDPLPYQTTSYDQVWELAHKAILGGAYICARHHVDTLLAHHARGVRGVGRDLLVCPTQVSAMDGVPGPLLELLAGRVRTWNQYVIRGY